MSVRRLSWCTFSLGFCEGFSWRSPVLLLWWLALRSRALALSVRLCSGGRRVGEGEAEAETVPLATDGDSERPFTAPFTPAHKRVHMDQSDAFKRCKLLLEVQKLIKISIYIYTLLNSICHGFLEFKPLKILWIQHWRRLLKAMITVSTPAWRLHYCCITFV